MRYFLLSILTFSLLIAQTNFNKVGTAGMLFLTIPSNAAEQAMGKAFSGMQQGASAAFSNPALLGFEKSLQVFTGYTGWLLGLHHQSAAMSFRLGRLGIGISQMLLTTEPMTVTTTRQPLGTGATFNYLDVAIGLSVSRAFSSQFSLGGTIRYIHESVQSIKAQGFGIDIGSFYWIGYRDLRIFMVLRNFGPDLHYQGTFWDTRVKGNVRDDIELNYAAIPLPITFTLGLAGTVWESGERSLLIAVEADHPADYSQRIHIGSEFVPSKNLRLRGGYKFNYEQESWSGGCGIILNKIRLDVAYSAMKDFSGVMSYSIHYIIK